jgi:hypothetical protein
MYQCSAVIPCQYVRYFTLRVRARAEMSAFLVDDAIVGLAQPAPASQVRAWSSFEIRRVLICLMPWQNILRLRPAPEILADKLNNVGGLRPVACSICSRLNPFASTTDTATRSRHRAEDPRRSTGLGSIKSAKLIAPVSPRLRKKTPLGTDREMPPRPPSRVRWWRRDCVAEDAVGSEVLSRAPTEGLGRALGRTGASAFFIFEPIGRTAGTDAFYSASHGIKNPSL